MLATHRHTPRHEQGSSTGPAPPPPARSSRVDLLRRGGSLFEAYGIQHLERQVATMLGAILQLCQQVCGDCKVPRVCCCVCTALLLPCSSNIPAVCCSSPNTLMPACLYHPTPSTPCASMAVSLTTSTDAWTPTPRLQGREGTFQRAPTVPGSAGGCPALRALRPPRTVARVRMRVMHDHHGHN